VYGQGIESLLICKKLVRKGGLEPPWVAPPDPKSACEFSQIRCLYGRGACRLTCCH